MKLKDQVCNLELAKKLKELGVKQESVCYWRQFQLDSEFDNQIIWDVDTEMSYRSTISNVLQSIAAFTVAELGEMLQTDQGLLIPVPVDGRWNAPSPKNGQVVNLGRIGNTSEADARAKMLIYLLENDLITNKKTGV